MDQRKPSRTGRPGHSSGGWSQARKRKPEWLVKMQDGGQEDRVQAWVVQDEKNDKVEKTAKPMLPVEVGTQVVIPKEDKSTQAESHEFPADMVPDYVPWSTKP